MVGKEGFSLNGPFFAAVFFALHEALPDEIAGRHGDGEGQLGKIRSRGQGQRSGGGGSGDGELAISVLFQPFDGPFNPFKGIIVMAVVLFRGGHGQNIDAEAQEIFDRRAGHVVLGVIPQHGDHRAVRTGRAFPVCAVKAIFFRIKMNLFHQNSPPLC